MIFKKKEKKEMTNKEKSKTILLLLGFAIFLFVVRFILIKATNSNTQMTENTDSSNTTSSFVENNDLIIEVDETNFENIVLKSNKKVLIDFYATWCGPCKTIKPRIQEVAEENPDLKVVEIDIDKCQNIAEKYKISSIPTLVVIEKRVEVNRIVGAVPKSEILNLCNINY